MRHYRPGAHPKSDLKVNWFPWPKYRKPVLTGEVAIRVRDLLRQNAMEHVLEIVRQGRTRPRSPVRLLSSTSEPDHAVAERISSRVLLQDFPSLRKKFWGRHFWARGYLAASSGTITDEMIREYIDEQESEQIADDSRFPIDNH